MLNINQVALLVKEKFDKLISTIKNHTFESRITNLNEIPKIKFPVIQDVNVIGDTTSEVLEDLNSTLSSYLEDIKEKIKPQEIDLKPIIDKLDTLKDTNVNKSIEDLLKVISKKEVSFDSVEKQLNNISELLKKSLEKKKEKKSKIKTYDKILEDIKTTIANIYVPAPPKAIKIKNSSGTDINPATEDTLQKLVGFDENSDIDVNITTVGAIKTITETDGVKTRVTVIDKTDPDDFDITINWT